MATRRGVLSGGSATFAGLVTPKQVQSPFDVQGIYLDAAFSHPLGSFAAAAGRDYIAARQADPRAVGPGRNARRDAVAQFAALVGVSSDSVAVVPSTMSGENFIVHALGIGPGAGAVTDAFHYDASLALYGELARRGTPVSVVRPRNLRIDLADVARAITPQTRLVAVSLVSGLTGFSHDLAELCELVHRRGALVYADVIQAAGAMDLDLAASGVDFACAGTYKWLMGEFGCAFLYARKDRVDLLSRTDIGWRQIADQQSHVLPFDPPGPALGTYTLGTEMAQRVEVSTPAWQALAVASKSIAWLRAAGVGRIAERRSALLQRLAAGLHGSAWRALTPANSPAPMAVYSLQDAAARIGPRLTGESIVISTYANHVRVSPSLYNDADDIDRLVAVMLGA